MGRAKRQARTVAVAVAVALTSASCAAGGEGDGGGEIVITCTSCAGGDDPFLRYRHELAGRFNAEYRGRYRIEILPNVVGAGAELEQAYQRLAIAGDLPDLFVHTAAPLTNYDRTQPLMDFGPLLARDPAFADGFYDGILRFLTLADGRVIGIPEQRDVMGFYYNTAVLDAAGVAEPPADWAGFRSAAEKVRANGAIPVAVDGMFVTQVLLSHLIGTQPGGADYLRSGHVRDGRYADNPLWTSAVEYLRDLHTAGLVNEDAFTGDFQRASVPFLSGEAAAITNGPWYAEDLVGEAAARGLAGHVVYTAAPGGGVSVFGGDAGWASAAEEPDEQEAVWAFIQFAYSPDEQFDRTQATGSFGPIEGGLDADRRARLNPLTVGLVDEAAQVPNSYPALTSLLPTSFQDAWNNYWPAYVQGAEDTRGFLTRLSDSLDS